MNTEPYWEESDLSTCLPAPLFICCLFPPTDSSVQSVCFHLPSFHPLSFTGSLVVSLFISMELLHRYSNMFCLKLPQNIYDTHTHTFWHNKPSHAQILATVQAERCSDTHNITLPYHMGACTRAHLLNNSLKQQHIHTNTDAHIHRYSQFEVAAGGTNCLSMGTRFLLFLLVFFPLRSLAAVLSSVPFHASTLPNSSLSPSILSFYPSAPSLFSLFLFLFSSALCNEYVSLCSGFGLAWLRNLSPNTHLLQTRTVHGRQQT